MGKKLALGGGVLSLLLASAAPAAVVLDYDLTGATTTAPADWSPTTTDPGITGAQLTRGPGVVAAGLTNGFSSDNWTLGSSSATAQTNGDYYQWGLTVQSGFEADLSTLDFSIRRSATNAPTNYEVYASFDGFTSSYGTPVSTFQYLGRSSGTAPTTVVPGQWMTTDTPGQNAGNPITTIDLTGVSALQDIAAGSTVTFRLIVWGDLAGAADTNTVALGRVDGPEIGGTVTAIPEPAGIALLALSAIGVLRRRR